MNELIREDGYINATGICKAGNKKFNDWHRLECTKALINLCENHTQIPKEKLLIIRKGGNDHKAQGSWIHPILSANLAQWISNEFSVKVSIWIEEWKQINNNQIIYNNEIVNLKPDYSNKKEAVIQLKLQKALGGNIEVETSSGFIDLLTDSEIIEIKDGKNWKHAVGQILIYSLDYPNYNKRIHLFNIINDEHINSKCKMYNIRVTYE